MKFKSKIVLMASIILMISSFAQVFALNIDIYPTKDPENNICYMEYENPHPNTIRSYFEKQKEKTLDSAGFVSDGACLCNIESDDFPTGGYYNGIKYMITVEPTSNYVGTKEDKNNYYEYVTYRTDQVYVDNDDGWKLNRTKHKGLRPVTKSKYNISVTDTKIAQSTDDYMIVNRCCKNGIGQYSWKVLCQTRSDATYRCNGHHSGDKVISNGHIYVSKNVITSEILQKIRQHPVYKSKEYKKNNYLYISEVKRMSESFVISRKNSTLYTSGQLVKAIVNPSGTIPQWGSSNIRDPESSLINTYDNKLHIAHLITKGLTVRYYDISGKENARIETDRVEDPNVKITKSNGTKFTPEDITNMKYKEEVVEMDQNSDDGYKIKVPDDAILIGYNVTINKQKDYANKVKIEIEHKNQVNYPGNSQGGDVYLDVFVNSKKRVYVRNKDLPEKYCDIDNSTIKNITPKIVKGLKNIEKSPIESEMVNQNDLLVDTSFKGEKQGEYTEVYWVPVKNYLLLKLIGEDDEDSDTSFAGFYIGQDPVAKKAKASLESWYTGEDPIKQQYDVAVNIATSKKDETTYVDMFYLDYKIDVIPSQIIEMSSEVDLTGGLYFQSDEEAFKQKTKNERLGHLVDDVIPSGETLYAGVLEVYPYILQSVNLLKEERIERITNGRQTTKFKV